MYTIWRQTNKSKRNFIDNKEAAFIYEKSLKDFMADSFKLTTKPLCFRCQYKLVRHATLRDNLKGENIGL